MVRRWTGRQAGLSTRARAPGRPQAAPCLQNARARSEAEAVSDGLLPLQAPELMEI